VTDTVFLHICVVGASSALGHRPDDVLLRILNLAGLAVHAIRRANLKHGLAVLFHDFVNTGRAVTLRWLVELWQVV